MNIFDNKTIDQTSFSWLNLLGMSKNVPLEVGTATKDEHAVRLDQVGRRLGQVVTYTTGAMNAAGTTTLPYDNTTPQNTEGNEYMTLAITPANASSTLEIDILWIGSNNQINVIVMALFQDSTANALAGVSEQCAADDARHLSLKYLMTSGTTAATTFKVRVGGNSAGTTTFNGVAGVAKLNGLLASRITIKEWLP